MNNNTVYGVQALRFVAAMLVVAAHATGMVGERMLKLEGEHFWRSGMSGVDLFFVISGYVMAISSANQIDRLGGWKIFLTRRLIRVVPIYWVATTLKLALVLLLPSLALNSQIDYWHVISSYLFWPTFDSTGRIILPLVKVGWTLSYEMFFYILFAAALYFKKPALFFTTAFFGLCTLLNLLSEEGDLFTFGFFGPIMLEFSMGIAVAKICSVKRTINPILGLATLIFSFAIMFSTGDYPIWWRWAYWGLPSMLIVMITVILEPKLKTIIPGIFIKLGDSSYSLYLFHTFIVPLIGTVLVKTGYLNPAVAVVTCLIVSPLVCYGIYKFFEVPVTDFFRAKFSI